MRSSSKSGGSWQSREGVEQDGQVLYDSGVRRDVELEKVGVKQERLR